jgi:lipoyl(octanoyl) transferase
MIRWAYLGRTDYGEALRLQEELVALRTAGRIGDILLLLEHPPVLTLGRNASRANILASDDLLARRGVALYEINRGGDVTYHGPGQLIGYPIFDLRSLSHPRGGRLGPVDFVRLMEEALIRLCGEFGVAAGRICGLTGAWCGLPAEHAGAACAAAPKTVAQGRKLCAIGIHVGRGVTSHGFAFNVTTDLRDFSLINPCGITDRPVTSLEREVADPKMLPSLASLAEMAARQFGEVFNEPMQRIENLAALRAQMQAARETTPEPRDPEFPAQDTPLTVPSEIDRLRRAKDRPVRA